MPARSAAALRVVAVIVGAALAGGALAALKGRGLDAAYLLGNSSAPYLLVPLVAGRLMSRRGVAVALGIVATWCSLASFYWAASALYLGRLSIDLSLGRWFVAGAISGALLGAVGHAARTRTRLRFLPPALLLGEPVVTAVAAGLGYGSGAPPAALLVAGATEAVAGLFVLAAVSRRRIPQFCLRTVSVLTSELCPRRGRHRCRGEGQMPARGGRAPPVGGW